jgi:hypothetical protein
MARWMLNQRPRGEEEATKRGYVGRRLTEAELIEEAEKLGLPVAKMDYTLSSGQVRLTRNGDPLTRGPGVHK